MDPKPLRSLILAAILHRGPQTGRQNLDSRDRPDMQYNDDALLKARDFCRNEQSLLATLRVAAVDKCGSPRSGGRYRRYGNNTMDAAGLAGQTAFSFAEFDCKERRELYLTRTLKERRIFARARAHVSYARGLRLVCQANHAVGPC